MRFFSTILFVSLVIASCKSYKPTEVTQRKLDRIDAMAQVPEPLKIIDFYTLSHAFDSTVYDFNAKGKYWPLVWIDSSKKNFDQDVVGLYTAIGDVRQGSNNHGMFHEALATMGATLGATLVGIDKRNQENRNYVAMLKNYFNRETGWNIMMNNTAPEVALLGGGYGRDWWYDVFPNVLFYAIYDQYPDEPGFDEIARSIADKFYLADSILNGNYNYSFFDYGNMKPEINHICAQPDAAAGHAWVLYSAYKKFKDPRYLQGALSAMKALEAQTKNPSYEVLMPFGAYVAARLNAEEGEKFDVEKMLRWSFYGTAECREGWGFLVGNWNGYDISGIVGSTVDHGGYGFLMNTYDAAWPLLPLVRYDASWANAMGKWMLNAANAARLFYPQYIPAGHQTIPQSDSVAKNVIAYEGLIKESSYEEYKDVKSPVAQGDGPKWVPGKNPPVSQFSVYGSGHVGIFGSIIRKTNVEGILQLNLLATDFFHDQAYPTFLYYNPFGKDTTVTIQFTGRDKVNLFNTITGEFVAKNISSGSEIKIPAEGAVIVVVVPAGSKITYDKNKTLIDGIVVRWDIAQN